MTKKIKLGYEVPTGEEISVSPSHLIVTGVTQLSGKTTTLEALIKRSGLKAIVFRTKVGEMGFTEGTIIPPFFRERSDWQYVQSLLEATLKERLKFERSWIIRACKNAESLLQVKANIDSMLAEGKLRKIDQDIFTTLQAYFELVLPQLQTTVFSKTLDIQEGINIMDLERFSTEIQALVIRSVLENVLKEQKNVIVVIPESWKFIPQGRGSPVKHPMEEFIRQGATNGNYIWIDSQDMTGVDKTALKQVSTWILGLQLEKNEVERTLDQMPIPKKQRPKADEIMTLKVGHFFLCTPQSTANVYVQPAWLDDDAAKDVAFGKKDITEIKKTSLNSITPMASTEASTNIGENYEIVHKTEIRQEMVQLRHDFFNKIQQLQDSINALSQQVMDVRAANRPVDTDEIVSLVLQKMPVSGGATVDVEAITNEVLKRVPKGGATTYEVAPLEKIKKDFLEEAKGKILADVQELTPDAKKALKYIEAVGRGVTTREVVTKCFLMKDGGGARDKVSKAYKDLMSAELVRKDKGGHAFPRLKDRIKELLENHEASDQDIQQVYDHILAEMLG